ncbi:MAG TPA: 50S ribosomal protein L11 methyltransferase, partial [Nitrospiria bacterium]|nr:50S ribosomal protein L11 methyltransferase [Nitrospiria bacterium]
MGITSPRRSDTKKKSKNGSTKSARKRKKSAKNNDDADRWLEIGVECDPAAGDGVAEQLGPYGEGGAVVELRPEGAARLSDNPVASSVWVKIYLPAAVWDRKRSRVERALRDLRKEYPISETRTRTLGREDWTEQWKKGYQIRKVGRRIVIVPSWKKYIPKESEIAVTMDPGMAFGTGLHPTTRLCLRALEKYLKTGQRVLDVGTGSGILAIAAVKLGAESVEALDIEAAAIDAARRNAAENGVAGRVKLHLGTLKELGAKIPPADLVLVNILAYTIIRMLPELKSKLRPGGRLVTGGILAEFRPDVEAALRQEGFEVIEALQEEDWVSLVA